MDIEIVAEGLRFPEGPVVLRDGAVIFVEIARGTLSRAKGGKVDVIAELGGGPNGAAFGPDGAMYVCNNGGRFEFPERDGLFFPGMRPGEHKGGFIQRVDLGTGKFETLYEACGDRRLNAPNDLVFDKSGGFYFTDHGTTQHDGGLFYAKADGSSIQCLLDHQASPNGVGLSPDERTLYFADTSPRKVYAHDVSAPGVIAENQSRKDSLLVELPEGLLLDSLAVEADGRVCVGTLLKGGIAVCAPDGTHELHAFPDLMTTNICFGGDDMRDAYLTLSSTGKIGKVRWPRPGLRVNFQQ